MPKLTKREAEKLGKLLRTRKKDVRKIGRLLNKFCLTLVEAKELREKIKRLDERIDKAVEAWLKAARRIGG